MSIQTEITRLAAAKDDLKTVLTAKGVTVPAGTRLDGYSALLAQIPGTDAYLDKETYDPRGFGRDIFADIAYLYKATFLVDSWTGNGPYTQTAAVTAVDGGPAITAESIMTSGLYCDDTVQGEAQEALLEAAALVDKGSKTFGAGTITCVVQGDKPEADAEVYFNAKKGGS